MTDDEISQHFKDKKEDFQKFYKSFKRVYESKNKNFSSNIFEDFLDIVERIHDNWYLSEYSDYTLLGEIRENTGAFNLKGPDNKDYVLKTHDPINLDKLYKVANSDFRYAVPEVIEYSKASPNKGKMIMEKLVKLEYQEGTTLVESLNALRDIHSLNITHDDISPGNLMMSKEGKPKFLDFMGTFGNTRFFSGNNGKTSVHKDIIALGRTLFHFKYLPYLKSLEIELTEEIEKNINYLPFGATNGHVTAAFENKVYKYKEKTAIDLAWCDSLYITKDKIERLKNYFEEKKKLDSSFPSIEELFSLENEEKKDKIYDDMNKMKFIDIKTFLLFLKINLTQKKVLKMIF